MKKIRQILALFGAIALICLYGATIFCALFAGENYMQLLRASIYATVIIPVLIWTYTMVYNLLHKKDKDRN